MCDGAQMAIFCILHFQRAVCSTFQTCTLNSHQGHTMCRSIADIQSATTEIRRGKKKLERKKQDKNILSASAMQGGHIKIYSHHSTLQQMKYDYKNKRYRPLQQLSKTKTSDMQQNIVTRSAIEITSPY